jgi:ATPase subunit of ABC transporter with duplicated ATPase domains
VSRSAAAPASSARTRISTTDDRRRDDPLHAAFYPRWRADLEQRYLRAFDLPAGRKVKALSRGMRTKLALLLAFSRGADLLILDEPTSGLDPVVTEKSCRRSSATSRARR